MGTMPYSFRNKFGKYLSDPVKAVNVLSLFYLVYIAFLIASSLLPEPFSEAAGAMAWLLPMLLFFPFMLTPDVPRDTGTGECTVSAPGFSFGRRAALVTLIFLLPALWVIMTVSAGTELLLGLAGASQEKEEITGSFWSAVFSLALAPAVLEELIFRVFPLRMMRASPGIAAAVVSAVMFSLMHTNIFSIPYAFAAGLIFAVADYIAQSFVPSFILHFLNNLLSAFLMYRGDDGLTTCIYIVIFVLALIVIVSLIVFRKKLSALFSFRGGSDRAIASASLRSLLVPEAALLFLLAVLALL